MPEWKPAGVLTAAAAGRHAIARRPLGALLLSACLALAPTSSVAQAPPSSETLPADIPGQALSTALVDFAHLTGLQIVYLDRIIGEQKTRGAPAGLPPANALTRLLEGTGLRYEFLNPRLVRILPPATLPKSDGPALEIVVYARMRGIPRARAFAPASEGELLKMRLANEEIERQIARRGLLYEDVALETYLNQLAGQLLATDNTDASAVHVRLTKGTNASALTLSDGSIYLSTALLTELDNESQLAAVLGRELTHYTNQHELRGLRREKSAWTTLITVEVLLAAAAGLAGAHNPGSTPPPGLYRPPPPRPSLEVWVRASVSGYPRDMEWEADDGSVHRLVAAGYDASSALTALYGLAAHASERVEDVPLYASQPKLYGRIASYRHLLEGEFADSASGGSTTRRDIYRARLGELPLDQVALLLESGALERANTVLAAELAASDSGRAEYLQGEIIRRRVPQSDATLVQAISAYERAVAMPGAPVSAYRQAGLLHRLRGDTEAAAVAFQSYLEHAPAAVDAPLVRIYLEELRRAAPASNVPP